LHKITNYIYHRYKILLLRGIRDAGARGNEMIGAKSKEERIVGKLPKKRRRKTLPGFDIWKL